MPTKDFASYDDAGTLQGDERMAARANPDTINEADVNITPAMIGEYIGNLVVINSARHYGLGGGVVSDTTALDAAFGSLQTGQKSLVMPSGQWVYDLDIGEGLTVPAGCKVVCEAKVHWQPNTNEDHQNNADKGTVIWFVGSGHKIHTVDNISAMQASGGRFDNPAWQDHATTPTPRSGISATSSAQYSLTDFTNEDAAGATRATLKQFNCGLIIDAGGGTVVEDLTVGVARKADADKVAIYNDPTHDAMADDVDVAVWIRNNAMGRFTGLQTIGYPRMLGLLDTWMPTDEDEPSNEYRLFIGCLFQGGAAFRSNDVYHVISKTSTSITIPWSPSHRFPTSGTIRSGLNTYDYTGLTFTDATTDTLTFTGIDDTSTIDVADWVWNVSGVTSGNFGCSGTRFMGCNFPGLAHASRLLETNTLLTNARTYAQAGIEISGSPCRALEFPHNTVLGSGEVGIHMHDCNDILFSACYGEGQSARETIGGAFTIDKGARVIASPFTGNNTRTLNGVTIAYPAGETGQYRDAFSTWNDSMDFSPSLGATPPRFGAHGGLFEPRSQANFGKGIDPKDSGIEWELPSGDSLKIGQRNGDALIEALNGDLILATPTSDDALVMKLGDVTVAEITDTAFNIGPSASNGIIRARNGEMDIRAATGSPVRLRSGTSTAMLVSTSGLQFASSGPKIFYGTGTPEGAITAGVGSQLLRTDGGAGTALYVKESGTGNTGWVAK